MRGSSLRDMNFAAKHFLTIKSIDEGCGVWYKTRLLPDGRGAGAGDAAAEKNLKKVIDGR